MTPFLRIEFKGCLPKQYLNDTDLDGAGPNMEDAVQTRYTAGSLSDFLTSPIRHFAFDDERNIVYFCDVTPTVVYDIRCFSSNRNEVVDRWTGKKQDLLWG